MFGSETLDVAIGLIFLFLLVSLICSSIKEALETVMKYRARDLHRGIQELLGGPGDNALVAAFYRHPLVSALYVGPYNPAKPGNLPSYIPPQTFALAYLDLVRHMAAAEPGAPDIFAPSVANPAIELRSAVLKTNNQALRGALIPLIDCSDGNLAAIRRNIEDWYNGAMDRVSGWYKRRTQQVIFVIGLFLAVLMNIDAIGIARYLNTNQTARSALMAQLGEHRSPAPPSDSELIDPEAWLERQGGMPVGWVFTPQPEQSKHDFQCDWRRAPFTPGGWLIKIGGLLLTTFAVSLGAPFWFDVLNKFMVVRSTVKPQEKSTAEKSKD